MILRIGQMKYQNVVSRQSTWCSCPMPFFYLLFRAAGLTLPQDLVLPLQWLRYTAAVMMTFASSKDILIPFNFLSLYLRSSTFVWSSKHAGTSCKEATFERRRKQVAINRYSLMLSTAYRSYARPIISLATKAFTLLIGSSLITFGGQKFAQIQLGTSKHITSVKSDLLRKQCCPP